MSGERKKDTAGRGEDKRNAVLTGEKKKEAAERGEGERGSIASGDRKKEASGGGGGKKETAGGSGGKGDFRYDLVIILILMLFTLLSRSYRLGFPPKMYFDEIYYAKAGQEYMQHKEDTNWVHPPLAKLIITQGMVFSRSMQAILVKFGMAKPIQYALEWRFASLVTGLLMIPLIYLFALRLFKKRYTAAVSAFLLSIELLHFVESRICMIDIFLAFFMLAGAFAAYCYIESEDKYGPYLFLTVIIFGLAAACKWSGIFGAFACYFCMIFLKTTEEERERLQEMEKSSLPAAIFRQCVVRYPRALTMGALFFIFGLSMQLISYIPFFVNGGKLDNLLSYYPRTLHFHYKEKWSHPYLSQMWMWPLMIRPIWYLFDEAYGKIYGIVAMGSPLFWWGFIILLIELIIVAAVERKREQIFLIFGYFSPFIFWIISNKGGFFYYMTPCAAWMALITAYGLERWRDTRAGTVMGWIYLAALFIFFICFLPIVAGYPIPREVFNKLMWIKSWI
ncbi:MAG: phospholipid carrier-dependent glycosyltransferase [Candidatus Xenobiia bacterium LiM19]